MFLTRIPQRFGLVLSTLGFSALAFGTAAPTQAAEEIVITYGFLQQSIPVNDLADFAESGEQSFTISLLVGASGQDPDNIRNVLNQDVPLKHSLADKLLNTAPGEAALQQVGNVVHTNGSEGRVESLRTAIMDSAEDDDQVSLIEVLQNYPTDAMYVDGEQLVTLVGKMKPLLDQLGTVQDVLDILGGL
ncbi:MAG: alpha/beta hydrolase [Spirulina sp. SIO3F2]|nr:alpha/beta hydrolase [Spirulina sp. SIO3F2]